MKNLPETKQNTTTKLHTVRPEHLLLNKMKQLLSMTGEDLASYLKTQEVI